jgi:hypothetical protein
MIHQLDWHNLRGRHFVPQAVVGKAPADFANAHNVKFSRGEDDLYYFEGALLRLDDKVDFILKRYDRNEERAQTTIYLPHDVSDIQDIMEIVSSIARELGVSRKEILWERKISDELQ